MTLLATLVLTAARLATAAEATAKSPNILLLVADDLRADGIAALGNTSVKTPHLDRLVREGFAFRNAYCLGSNQPAVCTPSRNMLLSGQTYFRDWPKGLAPGNGPNLPDALKSTGYFTYHHGKRGNVAREIHKRFDRSQYLDDDERERTSGEPGHTIVDGAIRFLDSYREPAPWLMVLEFEAPHDPRVAEQRFLDLYPEDEIPLPRNYLPVHPFDNGEMTVRDERLAPWPRTPEEVRRQLREYYAVISGLDFHIGRLLAALAEQKDAGETIVIFTSDHGLAVGSHGLFGKQNLYEHSMHVPLVFTGPGIKHGSSEALVYLLDLLPTICALARAKTPDEVDGQSLAPILRGEKAKVRDSLGTAYRDVQRAVRDERWKLIRYPQINRTQLFDLANDPDEMRDLSSDSRSAEQIARMTRLLEEWQHNVGDKQPLVVDKPRSAEFVPPRGP
ncbi:MAG TPA: sulfatase-like hydrolase/transferase [Pirellulales bacterium]|nr:sulfatase-like hydrolase/transferase [Pirellulales bacterium]